MDLYQLKTFFTLAKIKNFTKAAGLLFVTQSAVSHAIKKLESSLGTPLFVRKGKQLFLTEAGKALYHSCEKIFYEIEKVDQDIAQYRHKEVFTIRIGSTVEFGTTILINHIKAFLDTHPNIHLDFLFSHHLFEPLMQDDVDLIIDCKPHINQHFEKIHLFREQYITIASKLFIQQNKISSIDDLERVSLLSNDKDLIWWQNFVLAIPEDKKGCLKHVIQINHIRGIINGAIAGLGIGFVPKYTVIRELSEKSLVDPFPDIKPAADEFNIYIKKEKLGLKKTLLLIKYLTQLKPSEFGVG